MLVNEHDANILSVLSESVERSLDGRCVGLAVDNEKVLLSIGTCGYMLYHIMSLQ
jgi:hypothetical protein